MTKTNQKLSDIMLAMDVVDTLRHRENIIARELGAKQQDAKLIDRLRAIYTNQGLDVSDEILKDGVEALREDRFKYVESGSVFSRKIANIYISRKIWGRYLLFATLGLIAIILFYNIFIKQPSVDKIAQIQADKAYNLRIFSRNGEQTGIWRVPDTNTNAKNYYIIVEAIDLAGRPIGVFVTNEENNKTEKRSKFAIRVSEGVFNSVANDKKDDGIIQNNILGKKLKGEAVNYIDGVQGGVITQW